VKIYHVLTNKEEVLFNNLRHLPSLPQWLPDGSGVAVLISDELLLKGSDQLSAIKTNKPDKLVYFSDGKLFVGSLLTKSEEEIARFEGRNVFNISYSPCGTMVAFQVGGRGLFVADMESGDTRQIGHGERASWMPDSKFLVVSVVTDDGHDITGSDLFAVDVSNGQYTPLTAHTEIMAMRPSVSPCGKWVLFEDPAAGNIYKMALE